MLGPGEIEIDTGKSAGSTKSCLLPHAAQAVTVSSPAYARRQLMLVFIPLHTNSTHSWRHFRVALRSKETTSTVESAAPMGLPSIVIVTPASMFEVGPRGLASYPAATPQPGILEEVFRATGTHASRSISAHPGVVLLVVERVRSLRADEDVER